VFKQCLNTLFSIKIKSSYNAGNAASITFGEVFCVYNQKSKSFFGNRFLIKAVYLPINGSISDTQIAFHQIKNIESHTNGVTGNFSNTRTIHGNDIIHRVATIILKIT
jgi:hypothetical protein